MKAERMTTIRMFPTIMKPAMITTPRTSGKSRRKKASKRRRPTEQAGELEQNQQTQPEAGNAEAEKQDAFGAVVPRGVHVHRRDDAGRHADQERDERGGEPQGQRVGEPLEVELGDRQPVVE